jgi:hypothetical protein
MALAGKGSIGLPRPVKFLYSFPAVEIDRKEFQQAIGGTGNTGHLYTELCIEYLVNDQKQEK